MTTLSTHVLDTAHGCPAAGVKIRLFDAADAWLFEGFTNGDGRCPALPELRGGTYRIDFFVADYFRSKGVTLPDPPFLDVVPIAFGTGREGHYHVPLLVSPYGYSTYRGS
ncbi:hydroxyisourate hydrolase [Novosphingobium soli]|uniref:5-hydroxyisourate hydrolase n=1 Tax=Novosphingobium soli TaxID=574956 RepID=A0ABV6CTK2_9SPHN